MLRFAEAQRTRHHPRVVDVFRQLIRRRVIAVINDTCHHRAIEIAVDIGHQHFLADARHGDHPQPSPPGPAPRGSSTSCLPRWFCSDPSGSARECAQTCRYALRVGAPTTVALWMPGICGRRLAQRAERHVVVQGVETAGHVAAVAAAVGAILHEHIVAAGQFETAVAVGVRVQNQGEVLAGHQPDGVALAKQQVAVALHFFRRKRARFSPRSVST